VDEGGRGWSYQDFNIDWQAVCKIASPILTSYTTRTNGTCMSARFPGINWSYFGADPDWGGKQAAQILVDLTAALANYDVKVSNAIKGSIEVVPTELHKGVMVKLILERLLSFRASSLPAFALVMGDEPTDDAMFNALYKVIGNSPASSSLRTMKAFTISVGKRTTPANLYAKDVLDVERILSSLAASEKI